LALVLLGLVPRALFITIHTADHAALAISEAAHERERYGE
jgi:hypothetical protein